MWGDKSHRCENKLYSAHHLCDRIHGDADRNCNDEENQMKSFKEEHYRNNQFKRGRNNEYGNENKKEYKQNRSRRGNEESSLRIASRNTGE